MMSARNVLRQGWEEEVCKDLPMEFPADTYINVARSRTTAGPGVKYFYVRFSRATFIKEGFPPLSPEQRVRKDMFELGHYFDSRFLVSCLSPSLPFVRDATKLGTQISSGVLSRFVNSLIHPEVDQRPPDIQSALSQLETFRDSLGFLGRYSPLEVWNGGTWETAGIDDWIHRVLFIAWAASVTGYFWLSGWLGGYVLSCGRLG